VLHRGVSQGGSTLTQQLAKNLFLTQERTMTRKLQEVILSVWLERKYSKDELLDLYLNRVYFGSGAYGVEAAAQRYFGKSARNVTLQEAALLAGLVKSPSKLAPTRNYDGAERRSQVVLAAMSDAGYASEAQVKTALAVAPKIVKQSAGGSINYVADWVMDVLNDVVGRVEDRPEHLAAVAHVVGGEDADRLVRVGAPGGELPDLRVVALAVAEGGLEDRGVAGHPDHVGVRDEIGQVAGLEALTREVVEPDRHPRLGQLLQAIVHCFLLVSTWEWARRSSPSPPGCCPGPPRRPPRR